VKTASLSASNRLKAAIMAFDHRGGKSINPFSGRQRAIVCLIVQSIFDTPLTGAGRRKVRHIVLQEQ
jgi:hypothetical protein